MAVLSADEIRDLWMRAGGNPRQADKAVELALAASGGDPSFERVNPDGTVDRGLWAINSIYGKQSSTDPLENARAAVAASKNGSEWTAWQWLSNKVQWVGAAPNSPRSILSDILGIDDAVKFLGYLLMLLGGITWMIFAVVLFIMASRRFRKVVGFVGNVIGSGIGFGVGARAVDVVTTPKQKQQQKPTQPPPASPPAPTPPPPALPPGPPKSQPPAPLDETLTMELPWLQNWSNRRPPIKADVQPARGGRAHRFEEGRASIWKQMGIQPPKTKPLRGKEDFAFGRGREGVDPSVVFGRHSQGMIKFPNPDYNPKHGKR